MQERGDAVFRASHREPEPGVAAVLSGARSFAAIGERVADQSAERLAVLGDGAVVTVDARHTQTDTAITAAGGDYVFTVKKSQPGLHTPCKDLPWKDVPGLPRVWLTPDLWGFVLAGRMSTMAKAYPKEFRDDVVAVARKGQAPLNQIAKDFGICEGCLHNWMKKADVADGHRPGPARTRRTVPSCAS